MSPDLDRDVVCLLGLPFDRIDFCGVVRKIREAATHTRSCFFSTPNVNFLVASLADTNLRDSVIVSDLSIVDGMPLIWIAKLLGLPIRDRIAGSVLFEALRNTKDESLRVYFFGGQKGIAEVACRNLNAAAGGIVCVGYESPGFGSVDAMSSEETITRINASGADMVVVSVGLKKGQAWIERNRHRLSPPVIAYLGAVINFVAGTVRRAPAWMQRSGLEWMWRIKEEPGLWHRYLFDGISLLRLVVTRAIPYALHVRLHQPSRHDIDAATADIIEKGELVVIRLRGAWTEHNLHLLRSSFSKILPAAKNIQLDLERVGHVDASFLGLLLLVYGHQKKRGRALMCQPTNRSIRAIFKYACCEYLMRSI